MYISDWSKARNGGNWIYYSWLYLPRRQTWKFKSWNESLFLFRSYLIGMKEIVSPQIGLRNIALDSTSYVHTMVSIDYPHVIPSTREANLRRERQPRDSNYSSRFHTLSPWNNDGPTLHVAPHFYTYTLRNISGTTSGPWSTYLHYCQHVPKIEIAHAHRTYRQ